MFMNGITFKESWATLLVGGSFYIQPDLNYNLGFLKFMFWTLLQFGNFDELWAHLRLYIDNLNCSSSITSCWDFFFAKIRLIEFNFS